MNLICAAFGHDFGVWRREDNKLEFRCRRCGDKAPSRADSQQEVE